MKVKYIMGKMKLKNFSRLQLLTTMSKELRSVMVLSGIGTRAVCLGLPFLTSKITRGIKSMAPTEDPLVFKLDFADKFVNLLLVNDDSGLNKNWKTTISNLCPYRLGVQTKCRISEGFFSKFTSVKREGDLLYFAVPADGSTPQQRNKEFDSKEPPFMLNRSDRIEPKESTPPVL